jgi:hypothetical protein
MTTPSRAAAANIASAAAAVVLFNSADSPVADVLTAGPARSAGAYAAGTSGRCLLTTTHGLAGSVSENWRGSAAEGDGAPVADGGVSPTVAASGAGAAVVGTSAGEGAAEEGAGADDDGTAWGASGVQAVRTVSPAPTARKRAKLRRVVPAVPKAASQS